MREVYTSHMHFLKHSLWPIIAGFIVASIIMLVFEWINHFLFAIPAGLDTNDAAAVKAFTASLPWTAYILVFLGWAIGSFGAGCTTAWLAGERRSGVIISLTALLVLAGVFDMAMLGFPLLAWMLGILILAIFPHLGRMGLELFESKK